jgi:hypothetical protein
MSGPAGQHQCNSLSQCAITSYRCVCVESLKRRFTRYVSRIWDFARLSFPYCSHPVAVGSLCQFGWSSCGRNIL